MDRLSNFLNQPDFWSFRACDKNWLQPKMRNLGISWEAALFILPRTCFFGLEKGSRAKTDDVQSGCWKRDKPSLQFKIYSKLLSATPSQNPCFTSRFHFRKSPCFDLFLFSPGVHNIDLKPVPVGISQTVFHAGKREGYKGGPGLMRSSD